MNEIHKVMLTIIMTQSIINLALLSAALSKYLH